MWDGMTLIPGRDCGGCTVCCVWPSINKPEIQKVSGAACRHCSGGGCAINQSRPPVCRSYYCAWRTVDIFDDAWRPDKSGVLAYVERNDAHSRALQELRTAVRDRKRVATCMQFGPRFLHSTGQAYKGGPNSGVFLQITADTQADVKIPGRKASFGVIEAAQARGDFRVLAERGRRVLRAHIGAEVGAGVNSGLAALTKAARSALR